MERIKDESIFQNVVEFSVHGRDYRAELESCAPRQHVQIVPVYSRESGSVAYEYQTRVVCRGNAAAIWQALNK